MKAITTNILGSKDCCPWTHLPSWWQKAQMEPPENQAGLVLTAPQLPGQDKNAGKGFSDFLRTFNCSE